MSGVEVGMVWMGGWKDGMAGWDTCTSLMVDETGRSCPFRSLGRLEVDWFLCVWNCTCRCIYDSSPYVGVGSDINRQLHLRVHRMILILGHLKQTRLRYENLIHPDPSIAVAGMHVSEKKIITS